jgi:hypothetical protein
VPRLSILIPCPGGAHDFDSTLVSVLQNRPADCEVLVVHAEPYDDPYALAGEVRFEHLTGTSNVARLINQGCQLARGEFVHVLGCGLEVEEGWTEAALQHFIDPEVAAVSPLVMQPDGRRVVAAGVNYARAGWRKIAGVGLAENSRKLVRMRIAGPTLEAGFYRREVLELVGGFDEKLATEHADVDLALLLARCEQCAVVEPASRVFAGKVIQPERPGGSFGRGRSAERLFWRHASPMGLVLSLLLHPLAVLADLVSQRPDMGQIMSLLGRALAALEFGSWVAYRRRAEQAVERVQSERPPAAIVSLTVARAKAAHTAPDALAKSAPRRKAA